MPITCLSDQLRRDEDEKQFAYDDATGKTLLKGDTLKGNLTAGVGRNLTAKGLSAKERDFLLDNDIQDATIALEANFPWALELDDVRKGAMLNLIFNMGSHALLRLPEIYRRDEGEGLAHERKQSCSTPPPITKSRCGSRASPHKSNPGSGSR